MNYDNILQWANNISKGDELAIDLAHYSIEKFITHPRYEEIINRDIEDPKHGHCRGFILAIMRNSWFGKKSEFSRTYKLHRADIGSRKRYIEEDKFEELLQEGDIAYNYEQDFIIEAIQGIIEEMLIDNKKLWFSGKLFQMWLENPNYSELSRITEIPRTSISAAVEEAKQHIKEELKNRGFNYDF